MSAQKTQRDCQTAQKDANKETKIRGKSQIIRLVCSLVPFLLIKSDMNNSRKLQGRTTKSSMSFSMVECDCCMRSGGDLGFR